MGTASKRNGACREVKNPCRQRKKSAERSVGDWGESQSFARDIGGESSPLSGSPRRGIKTALRAKGSGGEKTPRDLSKDLC